MTRERRLKYHQQIETLLVIIAASPVPTARAAEVDEIHEDHAWDGLSCSCGGGWLVGHAAGCPEAAGGEV